MNNSTIHVKESTKLRLEALKKAGGISYDKLIRALLSLIPEGDDEGRYTDEFKASFLESSLDVVEGRLISLEELKRRLELE
ncbi:hypothetical protein IX51_02360 [uncultured archaeon]|nr:hypothetical protein IX51_02360 [uncultured archaeon]HKJ96343.1 hypothetical protein [Thermoplasmataceae archaeon]